MKETYKKYLGSFYFIYFAMGAFFPLLSQYLKQSGLNGVQIGLIMAMNSFLSIFFQPFWGILSDRTQKLKLILMNTIIASALLGILVSSIKSYLGLVIVFIFLYIFQSAVGPLADSMALHSGINYGSIRQWGSIGFAMAVFVSGMVAQYFKLYFIFYIYGISYFLSLIFIKSIKINHHKVEHRQIHGIKQLFKNPNYILFLIGCFFTFGPISSNNAYFGLLYEDLGGNLAGIGIAFLLFAASEAPFMKHSDFFIKRWGFTTVLMASTCISAVRWIWYSSAPSPILILILFVLQGASVGTYLSAAAQYIRENTPKELTTAALGIYTSLSIGVGSMICNFMGGYIYEHFSIEKVYLFLSIFTFIGLIPFGILQFRKIPRIFTERVN
ncbi:putative transporter YwbF [Clostridium polyendosporum]|uniref:Transporter YwbF n=1 Tax=Clostridium polyendosporum TaxID=69208 RepID=A0A919RWG9_9CLOT|nr:MFS transporter [Clostridium polyendosporum]GIM27732.1 putative transporter YwbF [Clostridium polyendosporum]